MFAPLPLSEVVQQADPGGAVLGWVVSRFTSDAQWFFAACAVIIVSSIGVFIWRYSTDPRLSLFLFLSLGPYFSSHNIMMQYVASSVWLWSIPSLMKRQIFRYLIVCALATSVHLSALALVPIYFLARTAIRSSTILVYAACGIAAWSLFDRLLLLVQKYAYSEYSDTAYGMVPANVLAFVLPSVLAALVVVAGRSKHLAAANETRAIGAAHASTRDSIKENMLGHLALLSVLFTGLGVTQALIVERVAQFFALGFLVSIPNAVRNVSVVWRPSVYAGVILVASIHFAVRNLSGDLTPSPYLTVWEVP